MREKEVFWIFMLDKFHIMNNKKVRGCLGDHSSTSVFIANCSLTSRSKMVNINIGEAESVTFGGTTQERWVGDVYNILKII